MRRFLNLALLATRKEKEIEKGKESRKKESLYREQSQRESLIQSSFLTNAPFPPPVIAGSLALKLQADSDPVQKSEASCSEQQHLPASDLILGPDHDQPETGVGAAGKEEGEGDDAVIVFVTEDSNSETSASEKVAQVELTFSPAVEADCELQQLHELQQPEEQQHESAAEREIKTNNNSNQSDEREDGCLQGECCFTNR